MTVRIAASTSARSGLSSRCKPGIGCEGCKGCKGCKGCNGCERCNRCKAWTVPFMQLSPLRNWRQFNSVTSRACARECAGLAREVLLLAGLVGETDPLEHARGEPLTAPSGKRKGVKEDGADLLVELLANEMARAMQPRFHRFRFDAEQIGGFLDTHALDDADHENHAIDFGQGIGRVLDQLKYLTLRHGSFRSEERRVG